MYNYSGWHFLVCTHFSWDKMALTRERSHWYQWHATRSCINIVHTWFSWYQAYREKSHLYRQCVIRLCINIILCVLVDIRRGLPGRNHVCINSVSPDWGFLPCSADVHHHISRGRRGHHREKPTRVYGEWFALSRNCSQSLWIGPTIKYNLF